MRADGRYERRDEPFPRPRHLLRAVRRLLRLGLEDRRSGEEPRRDWPCSHGLVGPDPHSLRGRPRPDGEDRGGLPRRRRPDPGRARVSRRRPNQAAGHRAGEPHGAGHGDAARREARADLQLSDAAAAFAAGAQAAGLAPPARFGTESVARLLGLRTTIPSSRTISSSCPATRSRGRRPPTRSRRSSTSPAGSTTTPKRRPRRSMLPQLDAWQKRVLNTAVKLIGFPYVWGGTSEAPESPFGVSAPGGFDCSGFVWRVYKLQAYPGGAGSRGDAQGPHDLPDERRGAEEQAHRVREARSRRPRLLRADGPRSKPGSVGHMGIYLGGGWMIHSSGQGVSLSPLTGWYRQQFAWGAGLWPRPAWSPRARAELGELQALPLPGDCRRARHSTIDLDLIHVVGRLTMLHWNHRLVVIAAILALILLALGGLGYEDSLGSYNLYWYASDSPRLAAAAALGSHRARVRRGPGRRVRRGRGLRGHAAQDDDARRARRAPLRLDARRPVPGARRRGRHRRGLALLRLRGRVDRALRLGGGPARRVPGARDHAADRAPSADQDRLQRLRARAGSHGRWSRLGAAARRRRRAGCSPASARPHPPSTPST